MQHRSVLLNRPDFSKLGRVVLDGARFCSSELAALVTTHRCQRGQDDLVETALTASDDPANLSAR